MSQFIDIKPVRPEDGIPREALLDDLAAFEFYIKREKKFSGELWVYGGQVHNAPRTENGTRFHTFVVAEDATREGALADVAAIRKQVSALPSGCGVL